MTKSNVLYTIIGRIPDGFYLPSKDPQGVSSEPYNEMIAHWTCPTKFSVENKK